MAAEEKQYETDETFPEWSEEKMKKLWEKINLDRLVRHVSTLVYLHNCPMFSPIITQMRKELPTDCCHNQVHRKNG